jgi:tetratricopeptide (TPR) repeat protein
VPADDRIDAYADALFRIAAAEGRLDEVEDELFRFARVLEGSDELRNALTDPATPAGRRQQIVEDLLKDRATPTTVGLVSMIVATGRGRDLPAIIDTLVEKIAEADGATREDLRDALYEVYERHYPVPGEGDLAFTLGLLLYELEDYGEALNCFEASLEQFGPDSATEYNIGLCRQQLGD